MNTTVHSTARLVVPHSHEDSVAVLHPETTLLQAATLLKHSQRQNAIVRDASGAITGVVTRSVLERQLSQFNDEDEPTWRSRSLEMLAESRCMTRGQIQTPTTSTTKEIPCTPVFENGRLVAIATPDDMLVSWKRMDGLVRNATTDELTGLMNRQTFIRRLTDELLRSERTKEPLSLLLIDVDGFKLINDEEGHLVGDAVLTEIGATLCHTLRRYDAVARFGGDEFMALCCNCHSENIAAPVTRLLREARVIQVPSTRQLNVSLSIGAVCVDTDFEGLSPTQLFDDADTALYRAKAAGRDSGFYSVCSAGVSSSPRQVAEWQGSLAVDNGLACST